MDHHPDDGAAPADVAAGDQPQEPRPLLRAAPRRALRVRQPSWKRGLEVGRRLGGDAARGRAHLRPGPGRDRLRALRRREVVLHGLRLRRQELADHQLPAVGRARAASRSGRWSRSTRSRRRAPARTAGSSAASRSTRRPSRRPTPIEIECKVAILAAGAMGTPPILMRSQQQRRAARRSRRTSAATSASTATTSPRSRSTRARPSACSACAAATTSSSRASRSRR